MPLGDESTPGSSAKLSRCITNLGNAGLSKPFKFVVWYLTAKSEAARLYRVRAGLGHEALNVLASWFIRTGDADKAGIVTSLGIKRAETAYQKLEARPHDFALACSVRALWATMTEHRCRLSSTREYVDMLARRVVELVPAIRAEKTVQALRQLVRVRKHLGTSYEKLGDTQVAYSYYVEALALAEGDADTESQARQLRKHCDRLGP